MEKSDSSVSEVTPSGRANNKNSLKTHRYGISVEMIRLPSISYSSLIRRKSCASQMNAENGGVPIQQKHRRRTMNMPDDTFIFVCVCVSMVCVVSDTRNVSNFNCIFHFLDLWLSAFVLSILFMMKWKVSNEMHTSDPVSSAIWLILLRSQPHLTAALYTIHENALNWELASPRVSVSYRKSGSYRTKYTSALAKWLDHTVNRRTSWEIFTGST